MTDTITIQARVDELRSYISIASNMLMGGKTSQKHLDAIEAHITRQDKRIKVLECAMGLMAGVEILTICRKCGRPSSDCNTCEDKLIKETTEKYIAMAEKVLKNKENITLEKGK